MNLHVFIYSNVNMTHARTFSKMVRFAPYKQIGKVFTLNNKITIMAHARLLLYTRQIVCSFSSRSDATASLCMPCSNKLMRVGNSNSMCMCTVCLYSLSHNTHRTSSLATCSFKVVIATSDKKSIHHGSHTPRI